MCTLYSHSQESMEVWPSPRNPLPCIRTSLTHNVSKHIQSHILYTCMHTFCLNFFKHSLSSSSSSSLSSSSLSLTTLTATHSHTHTYTAVNSTIVQQCNCSPLLLGHMCQLRKAQQLGQTILHCIPAILCMLFRSVVVVVPSFDTHHVYLATYICSGSNSTDTTKLKVIDNVYIL